MANRNGCTAALAALLALSVAVTACGADPSARAAVADPPHPVRQWVKRHPLPGAAKPSPRMGYETSYGYDPVSRLLIRWGGHNQGGGGEQNAETWTYDLDADAWTLKHPNDAPPGVCCAQQNVYDVAMGKFVRFPAFSGSHGWQSPREILLKNSSVWTYDLPTNTWRNMRPCPEPRVSPLHGAAWDPHHQVTVVHAGEGAGYGTLVYDLYANTWHEVHRRGEEPVTRESQPGFAYDAVHRLFVRFGSQFGSDERTYTYDLRKDEWRVYDLEPRPANREKEASPVLAADTQNGIVLCSIRRGGKHETWVLDVTKPQWTRLDLPGEPDPSGSRNRVLTYIEDRNQFVLENNTPGGDRGNREQQIWTFRYAAAPQPAPAIDLKVTAEPGAAVLTWTPPAPLSGATWNVYRGKGARPWKVTLRCVAKAVKGTTFRDAEVARGDAYLYQVRPIGGGEEGPPSRLARTQPPVVTDVRVSVTDAKRVEMVWQPLPGEDIVGYHVERAVVSVYSSDQVLRIKQRYRPASDAAVGAVKAIYPFKRLTSDPVPKTRFTDTGVDLTARQTEPAGEPIQTGPLLDRHIDAGGKPYRHGVYAYRVVAVNRLGVEGGPSPYRLTIPAAVEHVFSKEEGDEATHLKWAAGPEKGVKGYLVYRHDGRYDKQPIVRLTPKPISPTEFSDKEAGKATRRYEIVAVDVLGQEGVPSRPVWSRREWWRFYVPYVGDWHQ